MPAGAWLGDFAGLVKLQRSEDSSRYLLEVFHDPILGMRLDIDATHFGNEMRFINDYHGIAQSPNVAFVAYYAQFTGELAVGLITQRCVQPDEELLADYGRHFWATPDKAKPVGGARTLPSVSPPCALSPALLLPPAAAADKQEQQQE